MAMAIATAKRLAVMAGTVAVMSTAAVPAFGQEMTAPGYQYGDDGGPPPGSSATFTFELAVECEPPADAAFFGRVPAESLTPAQLADPDGDGVYTGSKIVPKFAPGGSQEEPVSLPVLIVQGPKGAGPVEPGYRVIKDFGTVVAEDRTFEVSVSFCDDGGSDDGDGSPVVSGDTNDDKGGQPPARGGGDAPSAPKVLPATGGVTVAAAVGALLIAGGMIARRLYR